MQLSAHYSNVTLDESNGALWARKHRDGICTQTGAVGAAIRNNKDFLRVGPDRNAIMKEGDGTLFANRDLLYARIMAYLEWARANLELAWHPAPNRLSALATTALATAGAASAPPADPCPPHTPGFVYPRAYLQLALAPTAEQRFYNDTVAHQKLVTIDRAHDNTNLAAMQSTVQGTIFNAVQMHPSYRPFEVAVAEDVPHKAFLFYRAVCDAMSLGDSGNRIATLRDTIQIRQSAGELTQDYYQRLDAAFTILDAQLGESITVDGVAGIYYNAKMLKAMLFSAGLSRSDVHDRSIYEIMKGKVSLNDPQAVVSFVLQDERNASDLLGGATPQGSALKATTDARPASNGGRTPRTMPRHCKACRYYGNDRADLSHESADCPYNDKNPRYVGKAKHAAAQAKGDRLKAERDAAKGAGAHAAAAPQNAPPAAFPSFTGHLPAVAPAADQALNSFFVALGVHPDA